MATKKKLLQAAAGTAAAGGAAGALNVEDVFSTYLYEGNGDFQAIGNGINLGQSNDGGSVLLDAGQNNYIRPSSNSGFALGTGAFTIEAFYFHRGSVSDLGPQFFDWDGTSSQLWLGFYGTELYFRTASNSDLAPTVSQQVETWTHVAAVRDSSGNVSIYHNGTRVASGTGFNATNVTGTQPYIGSNAAGGATSYTDGFLSNVRISNTARYSGASITVPTSGFTSDSNTVLLTAQGDSPLTDSSSNALSITTNGDVTASTFGPFDAAEAVEGGMVWTKQRSGGEWHTLGDTERGTTQYIFTNATNANTTKSDGITSFNSDGYSISSWVAHNQSGEDYVSWTFRKAPKFFDVVTVTAPSSGTLQVSHDLGTTVGCIILKSTSDTDNWVVYHRGMGANYYATMNQTNPWVNVTGVFDGVTDTYFTLDTGKNCTAGRTYVAYLFAHNDGDADFGPTGDQDVISCGSFTSDSNGDISVELGWEPQFVLYRRTDQGGVWIMTDTMRGMSVDGGNNINYLAANSSTSEQNNATGVYPTPTGIGGNFNASANIPAIYIAIRRGPMAVPTDATDVFDATAYTSDGTNGRVISSSPSVVDLVLSLNRDSSNQSVFYDRIRGSKIELSGTSQTSEQTATNEGVTLDTNAGTVINSAGYYDWPNYGSENQVIYSWQRRPNFFDIVAFELSGNTNRELKHNLSAIPEMIWWKHRDSSSNWAVYHKDLGQSKYLHLQTTDAELTYSNLWGTSSFSSTAFYLNEPPFGSSGGNCIAYLFASLDGVSKVGSFSHTNGTSQNIDCGFSSGARFVMLKRYDSTGSWVVFDTERGIVAGNDPYLALNTTSAEVTSNDVIDPYSSGFTIASGFLATGDFIFYAIA